MGETYEQVIKDRKVLLNEVDLFLKDHSDLLDDLQRTGAISMLDVTLYEFKFKSLFAGDNFPSPMINEMMDIILRASKINMYIGYKKGYEAKEKGVVIVK